MNNKKSIIEGSSMNARSKLERKEFQGSQTHFMGKVVSITIVTEPLLALSTPLIY